MKITCFTSNQPRHMALVGRLSDVCDDLFVVQECTTIVPGMVADFYDKSEVMRRYFCRVISAERTVFGDAQFSGQKGHFLAVRMGDLNLVPKEVLRPALDSDMFVVFGSSYIREPLISELVAKPAYNLHMGVSPYYRGTSCNFWALHDGRPELVGATVHVLTRGLDSGPMLFHALPTPQEVDPFVFGMLAVKAAQEGFVEYLLSGKLMTCDPQHQDRGREVRYSRNRDFTDTVAADYLAALDGGHNPCLGMTRGPVGLYHNPYWYCP